MASRAGLPVHPVHDLLNIVGRRLNVFSENNVRYEGYLYAADPITSAVVMVGVKFHGTEGRPAIMDLPPKTTVYRFVVFHAACIRMISFSPSAPQGDMFEGESEWGPGIVLLSPCFDTEDVFPTYRPDSFVPCPARIPRPPKPSFTLRWLARMPLTGKLPIWSRDKFAMAMNDPEPTADGVAVDPWVDPREPKLAGFYCLYEFLPPRSGADQMYEVASLEEAEKCYPKKKLEDLYKIKPKQAWKEAGANIPPGASILLPKCDRPPCPPPSSVQSEDDISSGSQLGEDDDTLVQSENDTWFGSQLGEDDDTLVQSEDDAWIGSHLGEYDDLPVPGEYDDHLPLQGDDDAWLGSQIGEDYDTPLRSEDFMWIGSHLGEDYGIPVQSEDEAAWIWSQLGEDDDTPVQSEYDTSSGSKLRENDDNYIDEICDRLGWFSIDEEKNNEDKQGAFEADMDSFDLDTPARAPKGKGSRKKNKKKKSRK